MRPAAILDADLASRIERSVDALAPDLTTLLQSLVACRTDSQSADNPDFAPEAERCQAIVADWLDSLGMATERWQEPPRYPVVAGRLPGAGGGRSLALNGHVDVVPVGEAGAWSHDPWAGEVADGRLWGRGAADMKGGVAAALVALRALRDAGVRLAGDLWMHVVADEEVVGVSTRRLVARLPKVEAVIVAEPTDLLIMPVEGGLVHFRIEVEGRESHAGNRYMSVHAGGLGAQAGVNAIEKALKIVAALQELERQWGNLRGHPLLPAGFNTLMPGVIVGGPSGGRDGRLNLVSNPGTAPNYCSVEYNLWFLPGETLDQIRSEVETFVSDVCRTDPWLRTHPPRFTWNLRNISFPPAETPPDHPFLATLAGALTALGRAPAIAAFPAASELAWYAEQGIAGAIFGPGRIAQAHSPDEYVEIDQLVAASKAMALTAAAWCGLA
jgi:acetylornithine deacetylase/succinyl-diaminopimelate desuccinylase family protein